MLCRQGLKSEVGTLGVIFGIVVCEGGVCVGDGVVGIRGQGQNYKFWMLVDASWVCFPLLRVLEVGVAVRAQEILVSWVSAARRLGCGRWG